VAACGPLYREHGDGGGKVKQETGLDAGRRAYEASDYAKAIQALQFGRGHEPQNGDVQLLLVKSYLELQEHDPAIKSAEKAVAIDPQNSIYHEWLGRAYGEKAGHASWFSAISLAKKTRKEFDTAVQLDGMNYSARQALIEFDCSAPGIVGGGEEKALPQIKQLAEMGRRRRTLRDGKLPAAEERFRRGGRRIWESTGKQSKIGGADLRHRGLPAKRGPAGAFAYGRGHGRSDWRPATEGKSSTAGLRCLEEGKLGGSRPITREYAKKRRCDRDTRVPAVAHVWLGRLFENQNRIEDAAKELRLRAEMDPKNTMAQKRLKRLKKGLRRPAAGRPLERVAEEFESRGDDGYPRNGVVAIDALRANKLRAILTSLGVIIGSSFYRSGRPPLRSPARNYVCFHRLRARLQTLSKWSWYSGRISPSRSATKWTLEDIGAAKSIPNVVEVAGTRELPMNCGCRRSGAPRESGWS